MEDHDMLISTHINSIDMNKELPTSLAYLNKKRKFQAEQLGMPLPKHMCSSHQSYVERSYSPTSTETTESLACMIEGENSGRGQDDDSELGSEKDSNSFSGDADSTMSGEAKMDPGFVKACSYDKASTSSINWGGIRSNDALYSLESRSVTKSILDRPEQPPIGKEWDTLPSMNYDEHLLEFGDHGDCTCQGCRTEGIELSTEKELEILMGNGLNPNSYVLSSGRWTVNQDPQPLTKKLTIDKEFEQYFSMLML